jgi:hypothetical protein
MFIGCDLDGEEDTAVYIDANEKVKIKISYKYVQIAFLLK